ncbi:hypothetical protein SEPCBS119000_003550 [Sporothrix epigloea]|uniref:AA1-like domain-containing protein n=1 Tax=Sporothrix epigloea TaxID=1892477 RepID=A0ABP0DM88_9PEZI
MQYLSLLSLLATATTGLQLQYDIPAELLELFGTGSGSPSAVASTASLPSASPSVRNDSASTASTATSSALASCYYPATFTLSNFTTWLPAMNASLSYVSFQYLDRGTLISTSCAYNATSRSLTAGTELAPRIKFEASGSIVLTGLKCMSTNSSDGSCLGQSQGTLCSSAASLSANFTSQEPSPLQN